MSRVIDLVGRREAPTTALYFKHPAGVCLPFDYQSIGALIAPEVRAAIARGSFGTDMIACLPDMLRKGDRVLVIGAGLGVLSTLIAQNQSVDHVIALEADARRAAYLKSVHALNGVDRIETIQAAPTVVSSRTIVVPGDRVGSNGAQIPRNVNHAPSSAPAIDLGLVLADAQISMIVMDSSECPAELLGAFDLGLVERILVGGVDEPTRHALGESRGILEQGFIKGDQASVLCFRRAERLLQAA